MIGRIPVRDRGRVVAWATVDGDNLKALARYRWSLRDGGYAKRSTFVGGRGGRSVGYLMHREVLGMGTTKDDPRIVDHINGDRLDNRRANLRPCTRAENQQNRRGATRGSSSRFRGVSWRSDMRKWVAYGRLAGKTHRLGNFESEDEAARVAAAWRAEHMPFSSEAAA